MSGILKQDNWNSNNAMPVEVEIPNVGIIEFPDGMSQDEISSVLAKQFPSNRPASAALESPQFGASGSWEPESESSFFDPLKDTGIALGKGVMGLAEAGVGLADLVTGFAAAMDPSEPPQFGRIGKALKETVGYDPKVAKDFLSEYLSPEQKAADLAVQKAKGFLPTAAAMLENPSTIAQTVFEAAPQMLGGAGIARKAMSMVPKMSGAVAAGLGEGLPQAGTSAEQLRQTSPTGLITPKQAALSASSGLATGIIGVVGGKLGQQLGLLNIDTLFAGAPLTASAKSMTRQIIENAIVEGGEEVSQSALEQMHSNLALGKPLLEGVPEAAAQGLLAGIAMGVPGGVVGGSRKTQEKQPEEVPFTPITLGEGKAATSEPVAPEFTRDQITAAVEDKLAELKEKYNPVTSFDSKGNPVRDRPSIETREDRDIREFLEANQDSPEAIAKRLGWKIVEEQSQAPAQGKTPVTETSKPASQQKLSDLTPDEQAMQGDTRRDDELTDKEWGDKERGKSKLKRSQQTKKQTSLLKEAGVNVTDDFLNPSPDVEMHITGWTKDSNGLIQIRVEKHTADALSPYLVTVKSGDTLKAGMQDNIPGTSRYAESNPPQPIPEGGQARVSANLADDLFPDLKGRAPTLDRVRRSIVQAESDLEAKMDAAGDENIRSDNPIHAEVDLAQKRVDVLRKLGLKLEGEAVKGVKQEAQPAAPGVLYRGEGANIGWSGVPGVEWWSESKDVASAFGDIVQGTIAPNAKVLRLRNPPGTDPFQNEAGWNELVRIAEKYDIAFDKDIAQSGIGEELFMGQVPFRERTPIEINEDYWPTTPGPALVDAIRKEGYQIIHTDMLDGEGTIILDPSAIKRPPKITAPDVSGDPITLALQGKQTAPNVTFSEAQVSKLKEAGFSVIKKGTPTKGIGGPFRAWRFADGTVVSDIDPGIHADMVEGIETAVPRSTKQSEYYKLWGLEGHGAERGFVDERGFKTNEEAKAVPPAAPVIPEPVSKPAPEPAVVPEKAEGETKVAKPQENVTVESSGPTGGIGDSATNPVGGVPTPQIVQIIARRNKRDWSKLPSQFQLDAVRAAFQDVKDLFPKKAIQERITASKATTFDELNEAVSRALKKAGKPTAPIAEPSAKPAQLPSAETVKPKPAEPPASEPIRLTTKQMDAAKLKVRKHYKLDRPVTDAEVVAEIENLRRKEAKGNLDDSQERLLASLSVGKEPIPKPAAPPEAETPKPKPVQPFTQARYDYLKKMVAEPRVLPKAKAKLAAELSEMENNWPKETGIAAPPAAATGKEAIPFGKTDWLKLYEWAKDDPNVSDAWKKEAAPIMRRLIQGFKNFDETQAFTNDNLRPLFKKVGFEPTARATLESQPAPALAREISSGAPASPDVVRPAGAELLKVLEKHMDDLRYSRDQQVQGSGGWKKLDAQYRTAYKKWKEATAEPEPAPVVAKEAAKPAKTQRVQPEEPEELSQSTKSNDPFERARKGEDSAFNDLDDQFRQIYPEPEELGRVRPDPNQVRTPEAFVKLFNQSFAARDFEGVLEAIKATSDVGIWKPFLKDLFSKQATDPVAAAKAEWFRHVFNGTVPADAIPRPTPKPSAPHRPPPPVNPTPRPRAGTTPPPGAPPTPPAPAPQRIAVDPIPGGGAKSPFKIIEDFSAAIGKAIRVRRMKVNQLGTYSPGSTLTAEKFAGDLDTAAHELAGHWTDDRHGIGKPWVKPRTRSPYDAELAKFWIHGSVTHTSTLRYRRAEGIAEFIRAYVVNPKLAKSEAPNFSAYFERTLPPEALKAINDFGKDVRTWAGEDPIIRAGLNIRMDPPSLRERLWKGLRGRGFGFEINPVDRLRLWFDDSYHYAVKADKMIQELRGTKRLPQDDFELQARLLSTHDSRMGDQFESGLTPLRPGQQPNSKGKLEVTRLTDPVTKEPMTMKWLLGSFDPTSKANFQRDMRDASAYMVAQRTVEKGAAMGRESNISGIGAGIMTDVQAAKELLNRVAQDPAREGRLKEAARRYRLWAEQNINMLVDSGRLSKAQAKEIQDNNEQYVDMHRLSLEFDLANRIQRGVKIGTTRDVIKKFKGSTLELDNVYSNLLEQTDSIQKEAFRNVTMRTFTDGLTQVRALHGPNLMDFGQFGSVAKSADRNTITVFKDGKAEHWKFEPDIYESLKGLGELGTHAFIDLAALPSTFARYMITHSPQFIMRNITRDTFERTVQSRSGALPWDILAGYSKADLSRYEIFGGGQFGNYVVDRHVWNRELKRTMQELTKDPTTILLSPLKLKNAWEQLSAKSEKLGRIAEFRRAFDYGKKELGYDDYNAALYAAGQARGLLDFAKAGTVMRVINRLVPFSNAAMRGLGRSYTGLKENPARYGMRWGLSVLLPTLGILAWNRRDEETWEDYLQLPAYRRDFFWNLKVGPYWITIPKPHLLGVLAGGVERAIIRASGDKRAMEGFGGSFASGAMPIRDPVEGTGPLKTFLELEFNRDTFRDRDIVPVWERDLKLELRKGTEFASGAGKGIASAINATGLSIDPRQADYVLQSYGGLGQIATSLPRQTVKQTALKATGFVADSSGANARDVQWVLDWARKNGELSDKRIKDIRNLRKETFEEKDPAQRDILNRELREEATALREELEDEDRESQR